MVLWIIGSGMIARMTLSIFENIDFKEVECGSIRTLLLSSRLKALDEEKIG